MSRILLAVVFLLASSSSAPARDLVPIGGGTAIAQRSQRVTALVEDGLVRTTVRQVFVNEGERELEAIYEFPLPEGASLVGVAMEVGGKRYEGALADRKRARAVYDEIVRSKRDPALVEQIGARTFRLSVFPVVPRAETVVEISWIELATLVDGAWQVVVPLARGASGGCELVVEMQLRSATPFARVVASSDLAQVVMRTPSEALVALETTAVDGVPDLVVTAELDAREAGLAVQSFRDGSEDGWFLALFTPPRCAPEERIPRDVILVIDTSGSMEEDGKLEQARSAALWLVEHAQPGDRINVLRFSSDVQAFAPAPVELSPEKRAELASFVGSFRALGATALGDALKAAIQVPAEPGRVRTVVLLTDGVPTAGELHADKLVQLGIEARAAGLRVFAFGVGKDVNGALLTGLASASGGRAELFRPGGEIASRLTSFLARTSAPVLAELALAVDGPEVYDVLPRSLPDAHLGEQIAITGRFRGAGPGEITLTGAAGAERRTFVARHDFPAAAGGSAHVHQLFAQAKLAYLEEVHRLRTGLADDAYYAALDRGAYASADEIVAEMVAVSLGHGVQCAYTSFLVLLPEDRARLAMDGRGEPVLRDAGIFDANEESVSERDPDFIADSPFDDRAFNDVIGIGGGPGGIFGARFDGNRNLHAAGGWGTEQALMDGLEWLANHQHADGKWDGDDSTGHDVGVTSLALLAFLGHGDTTRTGLYRERVTSGIRWLRGQQDFESGRFGDPRDPAQLLDHALATLALCEAYYFSKSPLIRGSAQKAVVAIERARRPGGAWSRTADGLEDLELTSWMLAALWTAQEARLTVDRRVYRDVLEWLEWRGPGREDPSDGARAIAAELWCRTLVRPSAELDASMQARVELLLARPPSLDADGPAPDLLTCFHASQPLFQLAGESDWPSWNRALKSAVLDSQRKDADEKGSWDPQLGSDPIGGRAAATALGVLCLEADRRYARGIASTR